MKRAAVLKKIKRAAKTAGVDYLEVEQTRHTGLIVGDVHTTLARHGEVTEGTAEALYRQLQPALGKGWWRR